jgi:hypothetical protein
MAVDKKAYQTVIAGRVREDEAVTMFRLNEVALPTRVTNFNAQGGQKQPTLSKNWLQFPGVGKRGTVSDVIESYLPASYNVRV